MARSSWPFREDLVTALPFDRVHLQGEDLPALPPEVVDQVLAEGVASLDLSGVRSVGIPVGSRGIHGLARMVRRLEMLLKARGVVVARIPAMGSHGGGTPSGRAEVLLRLGLEPPFLDSDETWEPTPGLLWSRAAAAVDRILLLNRVKPHTSFRGPLESGLAKMLVVGLGGPAGARAFHAHPQADLGSVLLAKAQAALATGLVLGGFAVVENRAGETALVRFLPPHELLVEEEKLLRQARALLPRLPIPEIDVLVVQEMGKNLSGTGLDTNVVGRTGIPGFSVPEAPRVARLVVLDLTPESEGNANGVGLADVVTRALYRRVDLRATYLNCLTAGFPSRGRMPVVMPNAGLAIAAALFSLPAGGEPRVVVIQNTLHPEEAYVTPATSVAAEREGPYRIVCGRSRVTFRPRFRRGRKIGTL